MAKRLRRRNEQLLVWLRAAGIALATYGGLLGMQFRPAWGAALLALVAGGLAVASVDLGVTVAVLALSIPVLAANPLLGIVFAVLAVISVRYLGADGGRMFLLIATAIAGAVFGPVWAAVGIAGFLMGATEGAVAAAAACLAVDVAGLALGTGSVSSAMLGTQTAPLLSFADAPDSLFAFGWIPESFSRLNAGAVDSLVAGVAGVDSPLALAVQPALWAAGAVVAALLVAQARKRRSPVGAAGAVAAGTLVPAVGTVALSIAVGSPLAWSAVAIAAVSSAAIGAAFAAVYQLGFPILAEPARASMATEDAEVDELLRLIATAEEKLASQHTTTKVVLITDMKSFSRMTEEDGSIVTAKAIQKHRDLLLPVIETHHGRGKSTGGDGLVAAFDKPFDALQAAAAMQRALKAHNAGDHGSREMSVRIGVARGEVVLDKSGRPFIGGALNLAARVMNLADGGQVFADADLLSAETTALHVYSHGAFELKNIAKPVEVVEVLWEEGQQPRLHGDT